MIMTTILEEIKKGSVYTINEFSDKGIELDFSMMSLIAIDELIISSTKNGEIIKRSWFYKNHIDKIFSVAAYLGETIIKNTEAAKWYTNDQDPKGKNNIEIHFLHGIKSWPMLKVIDRINNGLEDSLYLYGLSLTKKQGKLEDEEAFSQLSTILQKKQTKKPWWRL